MRSQLKQWAQDCGVQLDVKNSGQHLIFKRDGHRAEWWPSTTRLVIDQRWKHALYAGSDQVARVLGRELKWYPPVVSDPVLVRPAYLDRLREIVD